MSNIILYFDEEKHRYSDNLGTDYTSVTQLIDKYSPKFDSKKVAEACARSGRRGNPKYAGKSAKQIMEEWKVINEEACDQGNRKHNFLDISIKQANNYTRVGEQKYTKGRIYTIKDILSPHSFGNVDLDFFSIVGIKDRYPAIFNVIKGLTESGYKIYTEIGVFSVDYAVSGLVDVLVVKDKDFIILDWKTNKAPIKYESGFFEKDEDGEMTGKYISKVEFMKPPISHLHNSNGVKYTLQLSLYTRLIESFGFKNRGILLTHIRNKCMAFDGVGDGEQIDILPISYVPSDVDLILNDYKKHRENIQTKINLW